MSEWNVRPLGTLCSIKTGKKDVNEGSADGAYPFFTCSTKVHASDSYSFNTEAILIAGNGAVGETKLYRGKFEAYQRTYVLDGFNEDLDYVFYVLKGSLMTELRKVVSGSTMPYIRKGDLEKFPISLPPLPEQKKIAHVLSTIQRAINAQERVIQITTELKKTLMHKLLTEGLRKGPQKQTEIGLVPERWDVVPFDKFATLQRGYDLRKQDFREGPVPVIGATQVIGYHDTANVRAPGVTVVRSGSSAGKPLFISEDFWAHNVLLFVKDFHGNVPKFVYYKILALDLTRYRQGVAVPTLNRNTFSAIELALPSLAEQQEIVSTLDTVENKIVITERIKVQLRDLFRTLLHELVTAKTRVHDINTDSLPVNK